MSKYQTAENIKAYIDRVTAGQTPDTLVEPQSLEHSDNVAVELAESGMNKLALNEQPTFTELASIEAIILPSVRPALDILNNEYSSPPAPWNHLDSESVRSILRPSLPSVGRINIPKLAQFPYAGTGFVVGTDLLMTNRHVAEYFVLGLGADNLQLTTSANVNFKHEQNEEGHEFFDIAGVVMIHPYWDMALLKVTGLSEFHPALTLSTRPIEEFIDKDIAVIGYPAFDHRNNRREQDKIFRSTYNIKRLLPGKIWERRQFKSYGKYVSTVAHDSSTLGGNSGSAVLSTDNGQVLGLHFAGDYMVANYAIASYDLARDARVVDAGVNFFDELAPSSEWNSAWSEFEQTKTPKIYTPAATSKSHTMQSTATVRYISDGRNLQLNMPISNTPIHISISTGDSCMSHQLLNEQHKTSSNYTDTDTQNDESTGWSLGPIKPNPDYNNRKGYNPTFLGSDFHVPLPWLSAEQYADVAFNRQSSTQRHLLKYEHFSVCMKRSRSLAYYSACMVDGRLTKDVGTPSSRWYEDPRIDIFEQYLNNAYADNPLDRGHLTRRLSPVWGNTLEEAKNSHDDTFHWTNSAPQHLGLNRGSKTWRAVEDHILRHARRTSVKLAVFTGPVLDHHDPIIRLNSGAGPTIQIPLQFWKIVSFINHDNRLAATAFLLKQNELIQGWLDNLELPAADKVDPFQVTLSHIESITDLSFGRLTTLDTLRSQESLNTFRQIRSTDDIIL